MISTNLKNGVTTMVLIKNLKQAFGKFTLAELQQNTMIHIKSLVEDRGDWNFSVYDLAWILCTDYFEDDEKEYWINSLFERQNLNGTWGDAHYLPHSALVDTLAVAMALTFLKVPIPHIEHFKQSLNGLIGACCAYPHHNTVGFEFIAPKMLEWLEAKIGCFTLSADVRTYLKGQFHKFDLKLKAIMDSGGLFSASLTLSFTAEMLLFLPRDYIEIGKLESMILQNGAVGLSPAATASTILLYQEYGQQPPAALYEYLDETFKDYGRQSFPNLHPIKTSRQLWNLLPWFVSDNVWQLVEKPEIRQQMLHIYCTICHDKEGRVSWDTNNTLLPDMDDTAVGFALYVALRATGSENIFPMSPRALELFRREDRSFFCYPFELHPSPASILHALMAVEYAEKAFGEAFLQNPTNYCLKQDLIHAFDPRNKTLDELGHDKWHATWTYGIQRWLARPTIHQVYGKRVLKLMDEVLERQQADGGWGQKASTLEETSYIVSGLINVQRSKYLSLSTAQSFTIRNRLSAAAQFMNEQICSNHIELPPLWISKNLYAPRYQIVSAILNAHYDLVREGIEGPSVKMFSVLSQQAGQYGSVKF